MTKEKNKETVKRRKSPLKKFYRAWVIVLVISVVLGAATGIWFMRGGVGTVSNMILDQTDGGIVNVLLLGTDGGGQRSDTIMLVNINSETGKLNILSIPRDTAIAKKDANGNTIGYDKINSYLGKGQYKESKGEIDEAEELIIAEVKKITGLPIHYFATVDFDGFIKIIDAMGGVDFYVPENMDYDDPYQNLHIHLKKGQQHLNGQKAHDFMRYRNYNSGRADLARIDAQQSFIKEIVKQKLTAENLSKADEIYKIVDENVKTNYSFDDLMLSFGTISKLTADKVNMYVLPNTPRMINGGSYVIYNTRDNLEKLEEILDEFRSEEQKSERAEVTGEK